MQEGGSHCAGEVRPALTPIHAGKSQAAALRACGGDIHSQGFERTRALRRQIIGTDITASAVGREPAKRGNAIVDAHAEGARDVIVAGAGSAEDRRSVGHERFACGSGQDAESFESRGDVGAIEAVVAMLALSEELDEALGLEALKMDAGRGGRDFGEHGEFRGGAGAAVDEAIEHTGTSGLADGSGDGGGREVMIFADIHSLMINESLVQGKGP